VSGRTARLACVGGVLLLWLTACGGEALPSPVMPTSPPVAPAPSQPPAAPPPEANQTPTNPPTQVPAAALEVVAAATSLLADELGVPASSIWLVEARPIQWSDASLGCPEPGMDYAQVITPGYMVTLGVGEEVYTLHTDLEGRAVFCPDHEGVPGEDIPADPMLADFILAARQDLATRLGVEGDSLEVVVAEAVEWPDTSMGCPQPGETYAQVITPGYHVVLRAGDEAYNYHGDYQRVFLCENPQ
jgi:hypothetical protein